MSVSTNVLADCSFQKRHFLSFYDSSARERNLFLFISWFRKFLWVMRHLPRIYEDISLFSVILMHVFSSSSSLRKQSTFRDATHGVSAK